MPIGRAYVSTPHGLLDYCKLAQVLYIGRAMAIEIERKFLVRNDSWRQGAQRSARIEQGYFCRTPLLRIRIFGDKGNPAR